VFAAPEGFLPAAGLQGCSPVCRRPALPSWTGKRKPELAATIGTAPHRIALRRPDTGSAGRHNTDRRRSVPSLIPPTDAVIPSLEKLRRHDDGSSAVVIPAATATRSPRRTKPDCHVESSGSRQSVAGLAVSDAGAWNSCLLTSTCVDVRFPKRFSVTAGPAWRALRASGRLKVNPVPGAVGRGMSRRELQRAIFHTQPAPADGADRRCLRPGACGQPPRWPGTCRPKP
jgi:hypothetical protein